MNKIKASEVSEVLLQQLHDIDSSSRFEEVGTVLTVGDGVARLYGLRNAEMSELLEFENGVMAVVMNLEEDNVGAVLFGGAEKVSEGMIADSLISSEVGIGYGGVVSDEEVEIVVPR